MWILEKDEIPLLHRATKWEIADGLDVLPPHKKTRWPQSPQSTASVMIATADSAATTSRLTLDADPQNRRDRVLRS